MQIDIFDNFKDVEEMLVQLTEKEISLATRRALKDTARNIRKLAIKKIKTQRRLTSTFIRQRLPLKIKANGQIIASMGANLQFSGKPIGLVHFVNVSSLKKRVGLGGKQLKGKRVTARIKPGKSTKLPKVFYAKARGGSDQLFRRSGDKRLPLKKASTPSLSAVIQQENRINALAMVASKRFGEKFAKELKFRLDVQMGRIKPNRLRKRK